MEDTVGLDVHGIAALQKRHIVTTDDSSKYDYYAGSGVNDDYHFSSFQASIVALRCNKNFADEISTGQECGIILNRTCFYAEQGGQMYDMGFMTKLGDDSVEFTVKNVQVWGGYVVHIGNIEGVLTIGDIVVAHLDTARRRTIMSNHTGTHVLNYALRKVLKTDADQKGSLVAPDRLRFDFSNKGPLTMDQIKQTELYSKELINKNEEVFGKQTSLAIAKTINGLRAVFDETYPDPVRVVSIGIPVQKLEADPFGPAGTETSVEFCGGTHVRYAGHIGDFVIANEEGIAKGIRRIVALTGPEAAKALKKTELLENKLNEIQTEANAGKEKKSKELVKKIVELIEDVSHALIPYWKKDEIRNALKNLKKKLDDKDRATKTAIANKVVDEIKTYVTENPNKPILVKELNAFSNTKALDSALKQVKSLSPETAAMFFSVDTDANKIFCLSFVPKGAIEKGLKANEWVKSVTTVMDGKGGGKPDSAQASGKNISCLNEVLDIAVKYAEEKLV